MSQPDPRPDPPEPSPVPPSPTPPPDGETSAPFSSGATLPRPSAAPVATAPRNTLGLVVVAVAVLALLVAVGSAAVSWRALDQAQTARDIASARQPVGSTGTGPVADPPSTSGAADPAQTTASPEEPPRSPGTPPALNEQTVYEPEYENQSLTLKSADCFAKMRVDLDEPRANVGANGSEFSLDPGCQGGAPWIRLDDGVEGSEATTAMKPGECYNAIRSSPIAEGAEVPLRKGGWLCLSTNYAAARERRDEWRMVLMEVVSINNDRTVVIRATAWNIPED